MPNEPTDMIVFLPQLLPLWSQAPSRYSTSNVKYKVTQGIVSSKGPFDDQSEATWLCCSEEVCVCVCVCPCACMCVCVCVSVCECVCVCVGEPAKWHRCSEAWFQRLCFLNQDPYRKWLSSLSEHNKETREILFHFQQLWKFPLYSSPSSLPHVLIMCSHKASAVSFSNSNTLYLPFALRCE